MPSPLDNLLAPIAARLAPQIGDRLVAVVARELDRHVNEKLLPELHQRVEAIVAAMLSDWKAQLDVVFAVELTGRIAETTGEILRAEKSQRPLFGEELYLPTTIVAGALPDDQYMTVSTPLTRDFLHPKFAEFCRVYGLELTLHRKIWEWAFIDERLRRAGMLQPGKRGLGFGVGRESLPALFANAGAHVTATDSPDDIQNWGEEYGGNRELLFKPHILSREAFDQRVGYEFCDMKEIPPHLTGYDFCWSSCCFEHLGDLQRGLDFVVESVERTLVVGGVACHTTELNLSSDERTIEAGRDVIYRKRDLLQLCDTLERRGHVVEKLRIEQGELLPDFLVDVPPYRKNPHLKLLIGEFVATSCGLVIRRGR